jgi:hypothetical protein
MTDKEIKELLERVETALLMQNYSFKAFTIMIYHLYRAILETWEIDPDDLDEGDEDLAIDLKDFTEVEELLAELKENPIWRRAIV